MTIENIKTFAKQYYFIILIILLITDGIYSYHQFSLFSIDGDVARIAAPDTSYINVLNDPFGFGILKTGKIHAGSNRYFAHITEFFYMREMPILLQEFVSPIDSIYITAAFAKTIIQSGMILLLAAYISIPFGLKRNDFLIGALLICPLFQVVGFYEYTAFIDGGITYALFYALPSMLLLVFLLPYYNKIITGKSSLSIYLKPIWLLLVIVLVFHGPLSGPVLLIICSTTLFYCWYTYWIRYPEKQFYNRIGSSVRSINKELLFSFSFVIIISLYSFYIGKFNTENIINTIPIGERFTHLIQGLPIIFLEWSNGVLPLFICILINILLLFFIKGNVFKKILTISGLLLLFSIIYIFLTPFGGYREYRYYILRRDTIQPVMVCLYFIWGLTSLYILKNSNSFKYVYAFFLCIVCIFYTLSDPLPTHTNECEREMLHQLETTKTECVLLTKDCSVIGWVTYETCESTKNASVLLKHWNITSKEIRYYYKP
jgi:hypothetical protein